MPSHGASRRRLGDYMCITDFANEYDRMVQFKISTRQFFETPSSSDMSSLRFFGAGAVAVGKSSIWLLTLLFSPSEEDRRRFRLSLMPATSLTIDVNLSIFAFILLSKSSTSLGTPSAVSDSALRFRFSLAFSLDHYSRSRFFL